MKIFHEGLSELLQINQFSSQKIAFLSIEQKIPQPFLGLTKKIPVYILGLHLRREFRHIAMFMDAVRVRQQFEVLFFMEVYNQHLLLILPLIALMGKKSLLCLHGNQQFAMNSWWRNWLLQYFRVYVRLFKNIQVVQFEVDDDVIPAKYRFPLESQLVIPHPAKGDVSPSYSIGERKPLDAPVKIGVVGMIRAGKPISKLIKELQKYLKGRSEFSLWLGTPFNSDLNISSQLTKMGIDLNQIDQVVNTEKTTDYLKFLKNVDIVAIYLEQDQYYYRASGVVSDCLSAGCFVACSDYPVIRHQIEFPVTVGATYQSLANLPEAIEKGVIHLREFGQDKHHIWRESRLAKSLAHYFD